MMERQQLSVGLRERSGKGVARQLRMKKRIPGVIYGKGFPNISIDLDLKEVSELFPTPASMNAIIDLDVPQHGKIVALLKDYQAHHIGRQFLHVDFYKLDLTQKIHVNVQIRLVGKSEGVKEGGILEVITRELNVFCLPANIPAFIEVDVTPLKIGQSLHLSHIQLPEGVETSQDSELTLVAIAAPKDESLLTASSAEGSKEPEVLTAKKPAEGDEKKAGGSTKSEKK